MKLCFSAAAAMVISATGALAEPATFVLDPIASILEVSGKVSAFDLGPQGTDSLKAQYTGQIAVDLTSASVRILDTTLIDAGITGNWQPIVGGEPGQAPADYGAKAGNFFAQAVGALRDIQIKFFSEELPLSGGSFDASKIVYGLPAGSGAALDYSVTGLLSSKGRKPLPGNFINRVATGATFSEVPGAQLLTIPIDVEIPFTLLSNNDSLIHVTGTLVGSRAMDNTPPVMQPPVIGGGNITISWSAVPGRQYQVQSSSNLAGWVPSGEKITAQAATASYTLPVKDTLEYFRVTQ